MRADKSTHELASAAFSVLAVDVSPSQRATYHALLAAKSIKVHFATNGEDALRMFARYQPDLVITDTELPVMDGFEFIQRLRLFTPDVLVVIHSAITDQSSLLKAINLKVTRYLIKPASRTQLSHTFDELLEQIALKKQQQLHQQVLALASRKQRRTAFKLREAAKAGGIGTWYWSFEEAQFEWDESMYELYQLNKTVPFEAIYPYWLNMVLPHQRVAVAEAFQQAVATQTRYSDEFTIQLADGSQKYIRSSAVPYLEDGLLVGLVGSDVDISAEKERETKLLEAKQQAESASQAKGTFLANMSHEIRTPLNGIIGLTDLTLQTELTEGQRTNLQRVFDASKHLLSILNDILDYSKMEAGMMRLEAAPMSIAQLMHDVAHVFSVTAQQKGLKMGVSLDANLPYVEADVFRLTQVLNNLLGNAIKFTQVGGVTLSAKLMDQQVDRVTIRISVQDTGIGIAPDKQASIFNAFSQEDASVTRLYGGTGLGLAIAKQLVELMQAQLQLSSELGKGSLFWFDLSLPIAAAPSKPVLDVRRQSFDFRCVGHILLCEDNPVNQAVALGYLQGYGCEVDVAHNGAEGIALAKQHHYDLILMDLQMPLVDGFEAAETIRTFNPAVPIIALSAAVLPADREKAKQAQMNGHLAKPIDVAALQQVLTQYMSVAGHQASPVIADQPRCEHEAKPVWQHIKIDQLIDLFGSEALVSNLLTTFATHYAQVELLFDQHQSIESLRRQLHALKGAAGNLLMVSLQQLAQTLHKTQDETLLKIGLNNLVQEIKACLFEIDQYQALNRLENGKHSE